LYWQSEWAWGLPLIALNVVIHVFCLGFIIQAAAHAISSRKGHRGFLAMFALLMSVTVTLVAILHGFEAAIWATAYWLLGALPDYPSAMLYSLNAITSYGHERFLLEGQWQLLGALEALNGMLLFGLSTAFLFHMIRTVLSFYETTDGSDKSIK
jgi:hypothetical protein